MVGVRVLVASGSRHGSTHDVAERVAGALSVAGHDVVVREVPDVTEEDVVAAEAVLLGSAVYEGRWLPEVLDLVSRQADLLRTARSGCSRPARWATDRHR